VELTGLLLMHHAPGPPFLLLIQDGDVVALECKERRLIGGFGRKGCRNRSLMIWLFTTLIRVATQQSDACTIESAVVEWTGCR
jgi:hypothetical protein